MDEDVIDKKEIKEGAPLAAISYISFVCVIVLALKSSNKFVNYHAKQGLVIFIGELICCAFLFLPVFGNLIYNVGLLIFIILAVYGIYSSLTGKMSKIPVVTEIASKFVI